MFQEVFVIAASVVTVSSTALRMYFFAVQTGKLLSQCYSYGLSNMAAI